MRFVRVPPYEIWANWTNFCRSWENGDFLEGQKCCILFHTQNEEKSKNLSPVYAYTHVYARKRDGGGKSAPPPESNRVNRAQSPPKGNRAEANIHVKERIDSLLMSRHGRSGWFGLVSVLRLMRLLGLDSASAGAGRSLLHRQ